MSLPNLCIMGTKFSETFYYHWQKWDTSTYRLSQNLSEQQICILTFSNVDHRVSNFYIRTSILSDLYAHQNFKISALAMGYYSHFKKAPLQLYTLLAKQSWY